MVGSTFSAQALIPPVRGGNEEAPASPPGPRLQSFWPRRLLHERDLPSRHPGARFDTVVIHTRRHLRAALSAAVEGQVVVARGGIRIVHQRPDETAARLVEPHPGGAALRHITTHRRLRIE